MLSPFGPLVGLIVFKYKTLDAKIVEEFRKANADTGLTTVAYLSPLEFIADYKWDSIGRIRLVRAYLYYTQKIICIIGLGLYFPLLFDTFWR